MADIRPFRGILYNPQKIKNIARVVTEPYDVISPAQQQLYYKIHPYNIIRLILGKRLSSDNSKNNQYTRANKYFTDWLKKDILQRDKKESIYIYTQSFLHPVRKEAPSERAEFERIHETVWEGFEAPSRLSNGVHNNRRRTRTGFIVLLKLEDFAKNTILPHENTFSQPVQDRLRLLQAVRANLSPIFALFSDPQRKINAILSQYKRTHRPYIVIEKDDVWHRLWSMSDKGKIRKIQRLLKDEQIFIADGHHRYEAALNYKVQMQRKKKRLNGSAPFNYVMTYLVATDDPGLTILPTHRVVKIKGYFKLEEIIQNLRKFFHLRKFFTSEELFSYMRDDKASGVFGAYFEKHKFFGFRLKHSKNVYKIIDRYKQNSHRDLDVAILHGLIIEHILNIFVSEDNIYYTRDAQEAIKLIDQGKYQAAFFLKPTTVRQVKCVAKTGGKMPQKSTYFYPKLLSGLVINAF